MQLFTFVMMVQALQKNPFLAKYTSHTNLQRARHTSYRTATQSLGQADILHI